MKSRFLWPRNSARRRGYTLIEVTIAATMMVVVMTGAVSILSTAGRMQQSTQLRSEAGSEASLALANIVQDLREASTVTLPQTYQMRIFYPTVSGDGYYDRYTPNTSNYVEYVRTNAAGVASATGTYLWRRKNGQTGREICKSVTGFNASLITQNSVRLTLTVRRAAGNRYSEVALNQKVVFLRNH